MVTFKLATHTKFWSTLLVVAIVFFSLVPYVAYMWVSNIALSTYLAGSVSAFFTNAEAYFVVLFSSSLVLFIDGFVVSVDFNRGGYASRMRRIIQS